MPRTIDLPKARYRAGCSCTGFLCSTSVNYNIVWIIVVYTFTSATHTRVLLFIFYWWNIHTSSHVYMSLIAKEQIDDKLIEFHTICDHCFCSSLMHNLFVSRLCSSHLFSSIFHLDYLDSNASFVPSVMFHLKWHIFYGIWSNISILCRKFVLLHVYLKNMEYMHFHFWFFSICWIFVLKFAKIFCMSF